MKRFAMFLLVLAALVVAGGFLFPSDLVLARSIEIDGSPSQVHHFVNDLKQWPEWSPFEADITLGEKTEGLGANQSWTSDDGNGNLKFTSSSAEQGVAFDMEFDGSPASSKIEYSLEDGKTKVTWSFDGNIDIPVIGPYIAMLAKGQISSSYDRGLESLKAKVEASK